MKNIYICDTGNRGLAIIKILTYSMSTSPFFFPYINSLENLIPFKT